MLNFFIKISGLFLFVLQLNAQELPVPKNIGDQHPRIFGHDMSLDQMKDLVKNEEWANSIVEKTKSRLEPIIRHYRENEDWLVSRLQMYWKNRSNQVFINGGNYDHAEGEAPVPTVKFIGGRGTKTDHMRPRLEDVLPYMDDPRGLYLQRKGTKDQWEWVPIPATGGISASINREILGLARDAAFLYWYEGDELYAKMATEILDTYLKGIYYLNEPIDLSHGHHQTLVSFTEFEVIQEHIINEITQCYDFLYHHLKTTNPENLDLYAYTFQKWADQLIKNGVSFNNWNLLQAAHISKIALVLENNDFYKNGKGGPYYLDQIMNRSSTRQWSMGKLMAYGYDTETGIWNESPGYSLNVLNDFIDFCKFYDRNFNTDLLNDLPVLKKSVKSSTQYLYPNKYMVSFGDGHYAKLRSEPVLYMIENAQKYDKPEQEEYFTQMLKTIFDKEIYSGKFVGRSIEDLFASEAIHVKEEIQVGKLTDFTSPLFYAPNTSWLVQRLGEVPEDALMISQIGSLGNHMHSNGIAMELYGKGLPLAPEMGHGSSYFSIEYAEYYTQFPAHNTVIVNGKSKYPEMKSNHAFKVMGMYPKSQNKEGNIKGYTFSELEFLEPETNSEQSRVMGIVKNNTGGYYVDIFRSKQKEGEDVKHEYFFHNLGQKLSLTNTKDEPLELKPVNSLAFGDGDLMAYDYMWDKKSVKTNQNFKGQFSLKMKERTVNMNLWFKGEENREIFSVLSPHSTAFRHGPLPENLNDLPIPTLVVKQNGEAWSRPFVAIYEPAENGKSAIETVNYFGDAEKVGIHVVEKSGKEEFIFSNTNNDEELIYNQLKVKGTYGIISKNENDFTLFLGKGKSISNGQYTLRINSGEAASASLKNENGKWYYSAEENTDFGIRVNNRVKKAVIKDASGKEYVGEYNKKSKSIIFKLPELGFQEINIALD